MLSWISMLLSADIFSDHLSLVASLTFPVFHLSASFFSLFALQVLVSMVMEEVMSYLKERKYFPGLLYNRAGGGNSDQSE